MEREINVGIIGCGGIANGKHFPALKATEGVKMVAFCDIIPERAEKAAKEYGTADAKVYEDYKKSTGDTTKTVIASTANPYKFSGAVYEAIGGRIDTGAAGLPANAWLMEQLTDNRPIISRDGVMPDFLRLLNQRGREINAVARAFNSGYGTAEGPQQALDCLKDIAQAAYEIRKEGFTHAP